VHKAVAGHLTSFSTIEMAPLCCLRLDLTAALLPWLRCTVYSQSSGLRVAQKLPDLLSFAKLEAASKSHAR
jgi:hypothetical protein